jgi:hypothetical protein
MHDLTSPAKKRLSPTQVIVVLTLAGIPHSFDSPAIQTRCLKSRGRAVLAYLYKHDKLLQLY